MLIPNPNKGTFVIKTTDKENISKVNVLSLDGKRLDIEVVIQEDQAQVHLKNVSQGIYYVHVLKENNKQSIKKFVVN